MSVNFTARDNSVRKTIEFEDGVVHSVSTVVEMPDNSEFNMSNYNAGELINLLKLPDEGELFGECTLIVARRAWIRANALFETIVDDYIREPVENGRITTCGAEADYWRERVGHFGKLVQSAFENGATHICWG